MSGTSVDTSSCTLSSVKIRGGSSRTTDSAVTLITRPASKRLADQAAAGPVEHDSHHQPLAAEFDEAGHALQLGHEAIAQLRAQAAGILHQLVVFHDVDRGEGSPHGQRISAEGGAVVAGLEDLGSRAMRHDGADRHARAEALGQRHHVRNDARPLMGEPASGAAGSALNLVDHQQPTLLVAKLPHLLQVFHPGRGDPAFALDGLEKDGNDVGIGLRQRAQRLDVVERDAHEAAHQGFEALLDLLVPGGREGGERAAVEGFLVDHDTWLGDSPVVAIEPSHLDGCLVGFQTRVAEEHVGHPRQADQAGGHRRLQRNLERLEVWMILPIWSVSAATRRGWL